MNIVIGSGPVGVTCAHALLEKGSPVTMLDAGLQLEENNQNVVDRLAKLSPDQWDKESLALLKSRMQADISGIPSKFSFGSDYPFRETAAHFPIACRGAQIMPSLAQGGLSTIWGATILPYIRDDIEDWPIRIEDLSEHYREAMKLMPFSAARDDLVEIFPLYADSFDTLQPSRQAQGILDDLQRHQNWLRNNGFIFGRARLAVKGRNGNQEGCLYCRMCMYGCPYGHIYSSSQTLAKLMIHPKFQYKNNFIAKKLMENRNNVVVEGIDRTNEQKVETIAQRVFLACGIIPTTAILLNSMNADQANLKIQHSQAFIFPLLRFKAQKGVINGELHSLSQVYLNLKDKAISSHLIQLQIYTYNDLFPSVLKNSILGPLLNIIPGLEEGLLNRLLIMQVFLHSNESDPIQFSALREKPGGVLKFALSATVSKRTREVISRVVSKVMKNWHSFGAIPLSPFLRIIPPGRSFHNGGSFPMSSDPRGFESDIWGRPSGFQRIHAVDASIFPSVPATTITLTAMANAHRIAFQFNDR